MESLTEKFKNSPFLYGFLFFIYFLIFIIAVVLIWVSFGIVNGTHYDQNKHDLVTTSEYQDIIACACLITVVLIFRPIAEVIYRKKSGTRICGEFIFAVVWIASFIIGFIGYGNLNYDTQTASGKNSQTTVQQQYAAILGIVGCSISAFALILLVLIYFCVGIYITRRKRIKEYLEVYETEGTASQRTTYGMEEETSSRPSRNNLEPISDRSRNMFFSERQDEIRREFTPSPKSFERKVTFEHRYSTPRSKSPVIIIDKNKDLPVGSSAAVANNELEEQIKTALGLDPYDYDFELPYDEVVVVES